MSNVTLHPIMKKQNQKPNGETPLKGIVVKMDWPPVTRRQRMFIRRALRLETRAKALFTKAREAIALAMQNGLQVEQPVEIDLAAEDGSKKTEVFAIKNNFAGEVAFKRSYVSKYSLEVVPKYKRAPKPAPETEAA